MKVKYRFYGMHGYSKRYSKDLADLVVMIPHLISFNLIPPLVVLNKIFENGMVDGGMSGKCEWKPFKINALEHKKLIKKLYEMGKGYTYIKPPSYIRTEIEWMIWKGSYSTGYPLKQSLKNHQRVEFWQKKQEIATADGNTKQYGKAFRAISYWIEKDMELTKPYIQKYHENKAQKKRGD